MSNSLGARLVDAAERHAERLALVCDDERLTYGQLFERSRRVASTLVTIRSEVGPGAVFGARGVG